MEEQYIGHEWDGITGLSRATLTFLSFTNPMLLYLFR